MTNIREHIILGYAIPILYFLMLIFVGGLNALLPSLIMTLAFFVSINYVYDHNQSLFTISNIICIVGFFIGFFLRYLIIAFEPSRLTVFAPYPLIGDMYGHLKTSLYLLLFIVVYAFFLRMSKRNSFVLQENQNNLENTINDFWTIVVYIGVLVVSFTYTFINIRLATQLDYGNYDQLFRFVGSIVKMFAYAHLYLFAKRKSKENLLCYLLYIVPTIYMSFIAAWKGTFFIEILVLCIVFHTGIKKIKKKYIIFFAFALLTIYPVISMMRDSYRYGTVVNYNVASMMNYNINNNVFFYYTDRLAYYDETYYALNVSSSIVEEYKASAGSILGRFFSGIIPRVIWNDKPVVNVGSHVTYVLLRYPISIYNNLTIGLLADGYLDNKMIGIIGVAMLFGWLVGKNENRSHSKDVLMQSYYVVFGKALYGFLEGDVAAKCLGLIFIVVSYHVCWFLCNKKISCCFKQN